MWSDAHAFDFANGDLAIESRVSHQVEARMAWTRPFGANSVQYGVDLGWQESSTIDLTLEGNNLSGATPGDEGYGRIFLGLKTGTGGMEIGYDSNKELRFTAGYNW